MNTDNQNQKSFIDKLHKEHTLTKEEWITLIEGRTPELPNISFPWRAKNATAITDTTSTCAD